MLIALVWGIIDVAFLKHVDAGNVGILISYSTSGGKPTITNEPAGSYFWINPFLGQTVVQYPTAQQSLVLASRANEGELPGNSTIACFMNGGGTLNIGLTVNWQVDPAHPEILYFKKPGVDLTSSLNNDIASTIVYGAVRSATTTECSNYTWQQILGDGTGASQIQQLQTDILSMLQRDLAPDGILVNQVFVNEKTPDPQIQAVLNAQIKAQQSALLKLQAQNEADAKRISAQGDADAIRIINAQLSKSPDYIQYLIAKEWDGHLPATLVTNSTNTSAVLAPFNKNTQ